MPAESCIKHTGGFWKFQDDYYEILGHDDCATVVLAIFEYWTNGEIARMKRSGETGGKWIDANISSVCEETRNHYSDKSVRAAIDRLEELKFLRIEQSRRGQMRRYLMDQVLIQACLDHRRKFAGKITADDLAFIGSHAGNHDGQITAVLDCYKEEEVKKEEEEHKTPVVPTENLSEPPSPISDKPEPFVSFQEFVWAWMARRGAKKPDKQTRTWAEEHWAKVQVTESQLAACLDGYFASEWAKSMGFKMPYFTRNPEKWLAADREIPHSNPHVHSRPANGKPSEDTQPPPARQGPSSAPNGQIPDTALEWNRVVTAGVPVERWDSRNGDAGNLRECLAEPDFGKLPKILAKCQAILVAKGAEGQWLTFYWLIRSDKSGKGRGWERVLNGEFNWMTAPKSAQQSESARKANAVESVVSRFKAAAEEAKRKREQSAAN